MNAIALRSLRTRRTAFASTFLSVVLATALVGSFAGLSGAAAQPGVSSGDQETLTIMGTVVGGWGAVIALFSLVSTLGIAIRQRDREIAGLRLVGATPRQVRRMVRTETAVVSVAGAAAGALLGWAGGAALLALLRGQGVVAADVDPYLALPSAGAVAVAMVAVSLVAATVAGARSTRRPVRLLGAEAETGTSRIPWWRTAIGLLLLAQAGSMAVLTVTVMKDSDDPFAPMQTAGSACIVAGVGLACLGPVLLRWAAVLARPLLSLGGAPAQLAAFNAARRSTTLGGVLGPAVVFVSATAGVLMMVGVDHRRLDALLTGDLRAEADTITTLNYVVTGMIALFAAIMVLNALAAVTIRRREELTRLRLAGATRDQVRRGVLVEAWLVGVVATVLGLAGAAATVVPYASARGEGVLPDGQLWVPAAVAVAALALVVGGTTLAVGRALGPRTATLSRTAVAA